VRPIVQSLMKKTSVLLMTAMAIAGGAGAVCADDALTATVPFAFHVGDAQLPAGAYVISRKIEQPNVITIAASSGERTSIVLSQPVAAETAGAQPRLEFRREAGGYYLARVVLSYADGREISIPAVSTAAPRSH
jgi:hypothetical protein